MAKTVVFCSRQYIPLRGHRDDATNMNAHGNPGNFKALLAFRAEAGDQILKKHLQKAPRNATYASKTTQNEIIDVVGIPIDARHHCC